VPQWRTIRILEQWQSTLGACLIRRDQRRGVLDSCSRSGKVGNAYFVTLVHRVPSILRESTYSAARTFGSCQTIIRSKFAAIDESFG
jgi:hypothetical protein